MIRPSMFIVAPKAFVLSTAPRLATRPRVLNELTDS